MSRSQTAVRATRIPADVQVATWANRGNGPVFPQPLTRIEMDPVAHGRAIAERVLAVLAGRPPKQPLVLTPQFITGATTRKPRAPMLTSQGKRKRHYHNGAQP